MIYEILQTIACGLVFGVVLIAIDKYFTDRNKHDKYFTDDGGSLVP
jgi:hypothetical protein